MFRAKWSFNLTYPAIGTVFEDNQSVSKIEAYDSTVDSLLE